MMDIIFSWSAACCGIREVFHLLMENWQIEYFFTSVVLFVMTDL